jgi:adenylate kinase family enzyme
MQRVAIIGNSGGGKSTLARKMAGRFDLPHVEIDRYLWQPSWQRVADEVFEAEHARLIAEECWILDGLGRFASIPDRLARATQIVLIDMPLWTHFSFAAERHAAWRAGTLEHPPAGIDEAPSLQALFKTMWDIDREWVPEIRRWVDDEAAKGKFVFTLGSIEELDEFTHRVDGT